MAEVFKKFAFENVTMGFPDQNVLKDCTFEFPLNKNCRIVFTSDREKFHFFHGLTQIEGFQSGQFLINQDDVCQFSFEEFMKYRLQIGFGFARRGLIHNRTLQQNLELPLLYHNTIPDDEYKDWFDYCVSFFDLHKDLQLRPADVSAAAQKATLILRAFIHRPEMVILDSPTLLLSSHHFANLLQLVDEQRKNFNLRHLFFSTYNEELSDCLAEENIILRKNNLELVKIRKLKRVGT